MNQIQARYRSEAPGTQKGDLWALSQNEWLAKSFFLDFVGNSLVSGVRFKFRILYLKEIQW